MRVHILGICGTFMGGIAAIAKAAGHEVSGSDQNVYPPMSTQLESLGIELTQGFGAAQLTPAARDALAGLGRQALHAYLLGVEHPDGRQYLEFRSDLPADLERLRAALRSMQMRPSSEAGAFAPKQ